MHDTPELIDITCLYLDRYDLLQCALVNKIWHKTVTPHIWRDIPELYAERSRAAFRKIVLDDYLHEKGRNTKNNKKLRSRGRSDPYMSPLAMYSYMIRRIPSIESLLDCFSPPDRSIYLEFKPNEKDNEPTEYDLACHFLKYCSAAEVECLALPMSVCDYPGFLEEIAEVILPRVQELELGDDYTVHPMLREQDLDLGFEFEAEPTPALEDWKFKYLLNRCSSKLRKLSIGWDILKTNDPRNYAEENENQESITGGQPKELTLMGYNEVPGSMEVWSWLWKRCGRVEKLEVFGTGGTVVSLAGGMSAHMPNLSKIYLGNDTGISDGLSGREIATLLSNCQNGWKVVEIRGYIEFDSLSTDALARHYPTLEALTLIGGGHFSEEDFISLLSSAPNLRSLVSIDDTISASSFIDLDPVTNSLKPWACEKSLTLFKVMVTDIPRPDLGNGHDITKEEYAGQGRELHHRVYERLSRFVNLERLMLGFSPYEGFKWRRGMFEHQYDSLEMSLESGLYKLEGLKELKELNVALTYTNVGLSEVKWMASNWPKLRIICGLENEEDSKRNSKTVRRIERWLEENYPEIEVVGDWNQMTSGYFLTPQSIENGGAFS
ncbi:hypothetical protein BGX27_008927 [Mortierella sp. AM989]|nr:hypothetical protein BGX27_008927 [Mortierella sp. AM989]